MIILNTAISWWRLCVWIGSRIKFSLKVALKRWQWCTVADYLMMRPRYYTNAVVDADRSRRLDSTSDNYGAASRDTLDHTYRQWYARTAKRYSIRCGVRNQWRSRNSGVVRSYCILTLQFLYISMWQAVQLWKAWLARLQVYAKNDLNWLWLPN